MVLIDTTDQGNEDVNLLLDQGVDVNAKRGEYGNALKAAARFGYTDNVELLLDRGADVTTEGGRSGNALNAATFRGNQDIVNLLLDKGANMYSQGGEHGNALQAAASCGNQDIVNLLLDRRADVNVQGSHYGYALQAAAFGGNQGIIKQLLSKGANVSLCTVGFQGASLLHAWKDKNTLKLLLEAGAGVYVAATDAFNQTPLHIAAKHNDPEVLQILKGFSLRLYVDRGDKDASTHWNHAINEWDIDGCTPLHRAVENNAFRAAEWLVTEGAKVDIEDFNKITPFQRASQMKNFTMMSLLFPNVPKCLINATDWRACLPQEGNENIILTSGGSEPAVQVMHDRRLKQYLYEKPYSLAFSTSSIPAQADDKRIATAIPRKEIVLLKYGRLLGPSLSGGVHWRWWRKVMRTREELLPSEERQQSTSPWLWKVQLNGIPSAVALHQHSRTECFLECRVLLPSCRLLSSSNQPSALKVEERNHAIIWVMAKTDRHQSKPGKPMLESKIFFTTLEYCEMPNSPTELFRPCIRQLGEEWNTICTVAENHLSDMRMETFRSNGRNTGLIKIHLSDAEMWTEFKRLHTTQMDTLRSLCKSYGQRNSQVLHEGSTSWGEKESNDFLGEIEQTDKTVKEKIASLNLASQELIQLEFNLTSIAEAQKSTSMNRSMKRLSWITFIFLPLMFIASLFGMNIDLLQSNPSWWLYIPFAAGTTILTLSIWILFKSNTGLEDRIEQWFGMLFRRRKLGDEESLLYRNYRETRTLQFPASGKKRS